MKGKYTSDHTEANHYGWKLQGSVSKNEAMLYFDETHVHLKIVTCTCAARTQPGEPRDIMWAHVKGILRCPRPHHIMQQQDRVNL